MAGSQKRTFANVMKRKTLGLFGGMLADLRNMEIKTLGGGSLKLGKLFDPAKWKDALGTPDINIATVDNNIQNIVHNDYPQSSVIARVYDRDSLINLLRERRKGGKEVEDKIRKAQYSVTIQVEKRDGAYSEFTKEKIADICTRAFGTSTNLMNRNKVTAEDVILIPDWESEYRTQSTYDLKRNSSTNPMSSTGAVTKESGEMFILKGDIVESILMDMFGEDVIEESEEDIVTEDEFRRMFECVLTESDFQDLKDIRKEMKRIGFKTLHGGLDRLKGYYKEELQKFRDELARGELPKCKPFTNFDEEGKNRFIKDKDQLIKYLFKRRYMEPSDDNPLLRFILGGRGNDRLNWQNQDSLEQYIEHVNRYFGKDIDERGISGNNFGYPVEAMVFLRALRRMQPEDEGDGRIFVLFTKKNPSDASSPVESISSFVGDRGSFKGSDYPDSDYVKYDGWKLSGWSMSEADINALSSGTSSECSALFTNASAETSGDVSSDSKISVLFTKKDPSNPSAPVDSISVFVGGPGSFTDANYPSEDAVEYDGWKLSGWSMSADAINKLSTGTSAECSALFSAVSSETSGDVGSGISILFKYKNPEKKNSLAQLLSTFVGTTADFGKIPADQIAERLPKFDEHRFEGWNPDPNEFNEGNFPKNRVAEVLAEFGKKESGANQWDLYIIPHKRLTSQNRPNREERFDDGTVRAKSSDEKYKPSDMRM